MIPIDLKAIPDVVLLFLYHELVRGPTLNYRSKRPFFQRKHVQYQSALHGLNSQPTQILILSNLESVIQNYSPKHFNNNQSTVQRIIHRRIFHPLIMDQRLCPGHKRLMIYQNPQLQKDKKQPYYPAQAFFNYLNKMQDQFEKQNVVNMHNPRITIMYN